MAQEIRAAVFEHRKVVAQFGGLYDDPGLAAYVSEIGAQLAAAADDDRWKFRFTILDHQHALAFAVAGGYVYVSRTMLALANSEAEIAAVLAHEMGHVIRRHGAQREQMQIDQKRAGVFPDIRALQNQTRDQEFEADVVGVQILAAAGYDPMAQARLLQVVGDFGEISNLIGLVSNEAVDPESHPMLADRIERASAAATAVEVAYQPWFDSTQLAGYDGSPIVVPNGGMIRRNVYLAAIDNIVYGPRPADGLVVGNTFVNAKLKFAFDLPPEFRFTRVGRTSLAEGPDGVTFRFDIQFRWWRSNTKMINYLKFNVGRRFDLNTIEGIEVDGMEAAVASGPVNSAAGVSRIYFAVIRYSRSAVFRFQFVLPDTSPETMVAGVQLSLRSLRKLNSAEANAFLPLRLEVVTVTAETTLESLAARMPLMNNPLLRLLALNGLPPGTELVPGQKIKVVVQ